MMAPGMMSGAALWLGATHAMKLVSAPRWRSLASCSIVVSTDSKKGADDAPSSAALEAMAGVARAESTCCRPSIEASGSPERSVRAPPDSTLVEPANSTKQSRPLLADRA